MAAQQEKASPNDTAGTEAGEDKDAFVHDTAVSLLSTIQSSGNKDGPALTECVYNELIKFVQVIEQRYEGELQEKAVKLEYENHTLLEALGSYYLGMERSNGDSSSVDELLDFVEDHFTTIPYGQQPSPSNTSPSTAEHEGEEGVFSSLSNNSPDSDDEFDKVSIHSGCSDSLLQRIRPSTGVLLSEKLRQHSSHSLSSLNSPVVQDDQYAQSGGSRLRYLFTTIRQWRDANAQCIYPPCDKRFRDLQQTLEKEANQLQREVNQLREALNSAITEKETHVLEKHKLIEDVAHQASFTGELQKEVQGLKQKARELASLERDRRAENVSLESQKRRLEMVIERLDKELEAKLSEQRENRKEETDRAAILEKLLDEANVQIEHERTKCQSAEKDFEVRIAKVVEERDHVRSLESNLRKKIRELENRFAVEQEAHGIQIAAHDRTGEILRSEIAKSFELLETSKHLNEQLDEVKDQLDIMKSKYNSLVSKYEALAEAEGIVNFELNSLNSAYDGRIFPKKPSDPDLGDLVIPTLAKLKRLASYIRHKDDTIERLEKEVETGKLKCEKYESALRASMYEKDSLASAVLYENDRSDEFRSERNDLHKKNDILAQEKATLEEELDDARIDAHETRTELADAELFRNKMHNNTFKEMYSLHLLPESVPLSDTDTILLYLNTLLASIPHLQRYHNMMEMNMCALRNAIVEDFPDYPNSLQHTHGQILKEFVDYSSQLLAKVRNIQSDLDDITRFYRGNTQDLHACIDRLREHNEDLRIQLGEVRVVCKNMYHIIWNDVTGFEERGTTVAVLKHIEACLPDLLVQDRCTCEVDPKMDEVRQKDASHVRSLEAECRLLKELNWELNHKVADLEAELVNVDDNLDVATEKQALGTNPVDQMQSTPVNVPAVLKESSVQRVSPARMPEAMKKEPVDEVAGKMATAQMLACQAAVKYNDMFPKSNEVTAVSLPSSTSTSLAISEKKQQAVAQREESSAAQQKSKDWRDLRVASRRLRRLLIDDEDDPIVKPVVGGQQEQLGCYEDIAEKYPEITMEEIAEAVEAKKRGTHLAFGGFEVEIESRSAKEDNVDEQEGSMDEEKESLDADFEESFHSAPTTPVPSDVAPSIDEVTNESSSATCGVRLNNDDEPFPKDFRQLNLEVPHNATRAPKQLEPSPIIKPSKSCGVILPPIPLIDALGLSWPPDGCLNMHKALQSPYNPFPFLRLPSANPIPVNTVAHMEKVMGPDMIQDSTRNLDKGTELSIPHTKNVKDPDAR